MLGCIHICSCIGICFCICAQTEHLHPAAEEAGPGQAGVPPPPDQVRRRWTKYMYTVYTVHCAVRTVHWIALHCSTIQCSAHLCTNLCQQHCAVYTVCVKCTSVFYRVCMIHGISVRLLALQCSGLHAVCSCTVYSVQCTVCSVQCAAIQYSIVQFEMYLVPTVYSVQCAVYSVQFCAVYSVQCAQSSVFIIAD
jgi:hypothetical protein